MASMTDDQRLAEWDWLDTPHGDRLHHATLTPTEALYLTDEGRLEGVRLTCGRVVECAFIPGIFSRMGVRRCQRCCDRLGLPRGTGSPKNDDACRTFVKQRMA